MDSEVSLHPHTSRNPYHVEGSGYPVLQRSVFAYFDILGYVGMVQAAYAVGAQSLALIKIHDALTGGREWLEEKHFANEFHSAFRKDRFALKAFTDNIAIGWPVRDNAEAELGDAFGKLIDFQFHMSLAGFFVRGAIAIGEAYVDDVAVFGNALLEAHDA